MLPSSTLNAFSTSGWVAFFVGEQFRKTSKMKIRALFLSFFAAVGLLRAEVDLDALVKVAQGSSKNAPAIIADAVSENPKDALRILSASLAAMPERAKEIVRAVLKVVPKQAPDVVRVAIESLPQLSAEIVPLATAMYPELAAEIRAAAEQAGSKVETALAAPSETNLGRGAGSAGASAPAFPAQPVRPDLVSPSQ